MCGICGIYGFNDPKLLARMCDAIKHRGPDDSGTYIDKNIMLGHRRLSIIDLNTGQQPIYNEDKSKVIVFNGEIYNYRELRKELEKQGHRFYTNSDTEVIIHCYEQYGEGCTTRLNGEFAFAIWDSAKGELFLARDRAGVKPLFFYYDKDKNGQQIFLFASEIKSILQYEGIRRDDDLIDLDSLHYLLNLRYLPLEKTMFKGISKLMPGHYLKLNGKGIIKGKYWELYISPEQKPIEYYIARLKSAMDSAVKRYLISDVPVGAFLSGGLDTSSIVYYASNELKKAGKQLQTYCMGFKEPTDEFRDAKIIAEKYGTDHKEIIIECDIIKDLPSTVWAIDAPKRNMWPYYINKEACKYTKVILGGSGGDEILGGYIYRYNFTKQIESLRKKKVTRQQIAEASKAIIRQIKDGKLIDDNKLKEYEKIRSIDDDEKLYLTNLFENKLFSDPEYLKQVYGDRLDLKNLPRIDGLFTQYFKKSRINLIENQLDVEFSTKMADDLLTVDDATSMAHSLESRAPFLDNELVNLSCKIPTEYKIHGDTGKYILRQAMKDVLPREIIEKKKWGFIPNTYSWYKKDLKPLASDILPNGIGIKQKFFDESRIKKILAHKVEPDMTMHYNLIWTLVLFEIWYKIYIESADIHKPKLSMDSLF